MKKVLRLMLAAVIMGMTVCLCAGMSVFAEKVSGEILNHTGEIVFFTWEFDTETKTLTVEEKFLTPHIGQVADGAAWQEYEEDILHVVIKHRGFSVRGIDHAEDITLDTGTGFTWTLDKASRTVTLNGTGAWPSGQTWPCMYRDLYDTIIIGDGIDLLSQDSGVRGTAFGPDCQRLILGKNTRLAEGENAIDLYAVAQEIVVDPDNSYYAAYDGVLYTKDYKKLIACPSRKTSIQFPEGVTTIGRNAFFSCNIHDLTIPWGVTTIEHGGIDMPELLDPQNPAKLVLPDTIVDYQGGNFVIRGIERNLNIYYPRHNEALAQGLAVPEYEYNARPTLYPQDSMAEFYPDVSEAPQAPVESSAPSEPPQESSEPASSSTPSESEPSADPVESSAESVESSESSESETSSSVPAVSSVLAESSEPAAESVPVSYEEVSVESPSPEPVRNFGWIVSVLLVICGAMVLTFIILRKRR